MKKLATLLLFTFTFALLCACGNAVTSTQSTTHSQSTAQTTPTQTQTFLYTDDLGRELTLPTEINKIAVTGDIAQMMIFALTPEKLVGTAGTWGESVKAHIPEQYHNLPNLGKLYGTSGDINHESILIAAPDIIIDMGEAKDGISEDLNNLQEKLNIPVVHISTQLDSYGNAFRELGILLNDSENSEKYALFCEDIYNSTLQTMQQVGENKITAIYLQGDTGTFVLPQNSYHSELLDLMTNNLASTNVQSSSGMGVEVDFEQILLWNPDVLIFGNNAIFDYVQDETKWQNLNAITNNTFYETPLEPYNWAGTPPSVQQYLGMMWYTELLYKDYINYDFESKVKQYFEMFYHKKLTDETYLNLIKNSLSKK